MDFSEGDIIEGKVTGIMKFGAFVSLPGGKSGLVHISEISNTYVNDVKDFLQEGQTIKVRVLAPDKNGRINLSIKRLEQAAEPPRSAPPQRPRPQEQTFTGARKPAPAPETFEDKLKAFMRDSESKMSDMKNPPEKKGSPRRMRTKPQ